MHQSVRDKWREYSEAFEGRLLTMYLDVKGLVTTGVGNLIDPVSEAVKLPWKHRDGRPANSAEITAAWQALKARQDLAHRDAKYAAALTGLTLTDADVDSLVERKLAENESFITAHYFPYFADFPADAQLAILSMAWAVGPGFPSKFPTFTAAVRAGDWLGARDNCTIREDGNPGVIPRNKANRVCFANAEIVTRCGLQRDILRWPDARPPVTPPDDQAAALAEVHAIAVDDREQYFAMLERNRREGTHEMSQPDDEEITKVEGRGQV